MSYKFGQIKISKKEFNGVYEVITDIELDKIRISEGNLANQHDTRYTIGYETEPGKVIPLYIKTPKKCHSSGCQQYDKNSAWKMGFDVSEDERWIIKFKAICDEIESLILQKLSSAPLNREKYINPKLITWEDNCYTRFNGELINPEDLKGLYCKATGVLKLASVYRQKSDYYLQVFLKECKFKKFNMNFRSMLTDSEDSEDEEGHDTVF